MRIVGTAAAVASLLVVLAAAAAPSQAGSADEVGLDPAASAAALAEFDALPPAEQEDLRLTAELKGLPLEEAYLQFGWQDDFAQYVDTLRNGAPDDFAGAEITGPRTAWVGFRGDAPPGVQAGLAGDDSLPGVSVAVRARKGFSERQLFAAAEAAHLAAAKVSGNATVTVPDAATGRIEVTVPAKHATKVKDAVARSGALTTTGTAGGGGTAAQSLSETDPLSAADALSVVVRSDTVTAGFDVVYGGIRASGCTTGFSVISAAGTYGVATAGHCNDSLTYDGRLSMRFQRDHLGSYGDTQWHTTSETEDDMFYVSDTTRRDVAAQGTPVVGQTLNRWGQYTRAQDVVYKTGTCRGLSICRLTMMSRRYAQGGDSGGPWYWGNTAYGIHSGYQWSWGYNRDQLTPLTYLDEGINVYLRTY